MAELYVVGWRLLLSSITLSAVVGFALLAGVLAFVLVEIYKVHFAGITKDGKRLVSDIPGSWPLIGNGPQFAGPRIKLLRWFCEVERAKGIGTQRLIVPGLHPGILIADPALVDFVFARPHIFTKGDDFKLKTKPVLGQGIFNSEGALWRKQRKAGAHFLSNQQLRHMTEVNLAQCWDNIQRELNDASLTHRAIDLQALFLDATTRTMGDMAFNADLNSSSEYCRDFDYANGIVSERAQNPIWQVKEFLTHPNPFTASKISKAFDTMRYMSYQLVETALYGASARSLREKGGFGAQPGSNPGLPSSGTAEKKTFIHHLAENINDTQIIADVAVTFLIAGRDTTAQGLTWTMWLLMRNPQIAHRMREELSAFERADGTLDISFDSLQPHNIPYTLAVFYETLRFYPPVPLELKETEQAVTFPDGTYLPAQRLVVWCLWSMGRSKRIWGEDAASFRPERWLEEDPSTEGSTEKRLRFVLRSQGEYPVFNGGPRLCLGKRMAEVQACFFLAHIVWKYDLEEILEGPDRGHLDFDGTDMRGQRVSKISLTLPMDGGLPCRARKRMNDKGREVS